MNGGREVRLAIGQLLVGGFPGEAIHEEFADLVREGCVGGAILFARNLRSCEEAADLTRRLQGIRAPEPLLLAVDQEGGRVQRLRAPFPELPPMRAVGRLRRKSIAARVGRLIGESLRLVGFHQDYAPVLDVDSNPANPVIGDRSFSDDPYLVARLGAAFIEGIQSGGVAACGKHFPGHGDTSEDSHLELPVLAHDRERLEAVELIPFRAAARAGVSAIMTAHIMFPALDPDHPATLSERVLKTLLRDGLGYDGVIVSDDLEMKAIADHYGVEDAAVRAVRAGCDQLLICHQPELVRRAHESLVSAVDSGTIDRGRIFEAASRVRRLKRQFHAMDDPPEVGGARTLEFGDPEHRALLAILRGDAPAPFVGGAGGDATVEYEFEGDPDEEIEIETASKS